MLDFTRWEKIGLTLACLALVVVFIACADIEDNSEIPITSESRDYNYLDLVVVQKGFYKGFESVVEREYRRTVTVKVVKELNSIAILDPREQVRVDLPKSDIKKLE